MNEQRALLDQLMGLNRDGDKPNQEVCDYRDRRVCKPYLCGLCVHDLFQNTKMDLGDCEKLHISKLREKYEGERKANDFGYENDLERELLRYISDVEKKIQRAQKRLEEQDGEQAKPLQDLENTKEVLEITAEIQETMQKAEDAGNEGEVDLSMELIQKVEMLKAKKATIQAQVMLKMERPFLPTPAPATEAPGSGSGTPTSTPAVPVVLAPGVSLTPAAPPIMPGKPSLMDVLPGNPLAMTNANQKLRVCDVCGAFLSIFDSDRRLADHFGGKLHLGYMQIRKKLEEIKKLKEERLELANKSRPADATTTSSSRGRRSRSKSRSRSRSRSRSKDRSSRHRSSRREGDRSDRRRDRHRRRSSSRERSSRRRR